MTDWTSLIDILSLVTGIAYILLEIGQKNAMWWIGIATGLCCAASFGWQHAWASAGLNLYYVGMSVWGLYQWRSDKAAAGSGIHLRRLTLPVLALSAALLLSGLPLLYWLLSSTGDPAPWLDGGVFILSMIGTWWLAKAYPQQWLLWILADALSTWLALALGRPLLALLYGAYTLSAVYGWWHWKTKGDYLK